MGRLRSEADQFGTMHADVAGGGGARHAFENLRGPNALPSLDVGGDLHAPGRSKLKRERANAVEGAQLASDVACDVAFVCCDAEVEVDVEGDEHATHTDHRDACARVWFARAGDRHQLARRHAARHFVEAAAAQRSGEAGTFDRAAGCVDAVGQHRNLELFAHARRQLARGGVGCSCVFVLHGDDRHDVAGADARVHAGVLAQVDLGCGARDDCVERINQWLVAREQGQHGAVVIGVAVHVGHVGTAARGIGADGGDHIGAAAFADVGHGFKQHVRRMPAWRNLPTSPDQIRYPQMSLSLRITSGPVQLRMITPRSATQLFTLARDPLLSRFLQWPAHETVQDSIDYINDARRFWEQRVAFLPGIFDTERDRLIGCTGVSQVDRTNRRGELGTWLGRPYQRRGFNLHAKAAMLHFAFSIIQLRRLELLVRVDNEASLASVRRLPRVREEGVLAQRLAFEHSERGGVESGGVELHDAVLFSLLADEWRPDEWPSVSVEGALA